jgi:hypothetical protein
LGDDDVEQDDTQIVEVEMNKRKGRMRDRHGNLIEDDEVCPDGGTLSVPAFYMDARVLDASSPPPAGKYFKHDSCGRVVVCDIAGEARRVGAAADYKERLGNMHKRHLRPMCDADPRLDQVDSAVHLKSESFSGRCPSCGYGRSSAAEGFSGVCLSCGYSHAGLPAAPAAAYARYSRRAV